MPVSQVTSLLSFTLTHPAATGLVAAPQMLQTPPALEGALPFVPELQAQGTAPGSPQVTRSGCCVWHSPLLTNHRARWILTIPHPLPLLPSPFL